MSNSSPNFEFFEDAQIDLVNLKVFALMMCMGKSRDKASVLFNLCMGPKIKKKENEIDESKHHHHYDEDKHDTITWKNARLI